VHWAHNSGSHPSVSRVDEEKYASLSFGGTIRIVAEIAGRELTPDANAGRKKRALIGTVLTEGHPVRDACGRAG